MSISDTVFPVGTDWSSIQLIEPLHPGLVEAFVAPKSPATSSEDALVLTPDFFAVFDGMSSPLRHSAEAASGRDYAQRLARATAELPADIDPQSAIKNLTAAVATMHPQHDGPAGAVAAICSIRRREIWRVGDVNISVGSHHIIGSKEVDRIVAAFRSAVNQAHLASGSSIEEIIRDDPGLNAAFPLLVKQPALANRAIPMGYGVFNGDRVPTELIEVFPVPEGEEVVIASDGYLGARPSLAFAEAELRDAIRRDPASLWELRDMAKASLPGANAPDDRSYIRFRFHQ